MLPMIKNASAYTEFVVGRPIVGDESGLTQEKTSWGVNAHLRIEGWMD